MKQIAHDLAGSGLLRWSAVCAVVALVIGIPLSRRLERSSLGSVLALAATLEIVAITLIVRDPNLFHRGAHPPLRDALTWWQQGWTKNHLFDPHRTEWLLNVVLFAPAGLLWTTLTRNGVLTAGWLMILSIVIETVQALTGSGVGDTADLAANTVGAVVGVVLGLMWVAANGHHERVSPTGALSAIIGLLALGVGTLGVARVVLDRRTDHLLTEVRTRFAGMTSVDIQPYVNADDTDGATFDQLLAMVPVRADSFQYGDGGQVIDIRYPLGLLGVHRCVFARFTPSDVTFRTGSGTVCTMFGG